LFCATDRHGQHAFFDFYDLEWNHYPIINGHPNSPKQVEKLVHFREMIDAARKLSKDFSLVRVNLYDEQKGVFFGELTFLHFGGLHPFVPAEYDDFFGNMFDISNVKKSTAEH